MKMLNTYLPQILIFIGLLLTFVGGLISFNRDEKTQIENSALVVENKRLIESNLTISELIKNNITGGDSYGVITPLILLQNNQDVYSLYFENKGNFPIHDVNIRYWNPDDFVGKHNSDRRLTSDLLQYYKIATLGNIPANGGQSFGVIFSLKEGTILKLNINISTKNGSFSQLLRILKENGKIYVAIKVNTIGKNSKVIFEQVDPDYPKNIDGTANWEFIKAN